MGRNLRCSVFDMPTVALFQGSESSKNGRNRKLIKFFRTGIDCPGMVDIPKMKENQKVGCRGNEKKGRGYFCNFLCYKT